MGLFNKKSPNEEPDNTVDVKKAKKKKDGMSSILHESVPETVLDDLSSNEAFVMNRDGEDVYVGLLLNADDIGGISKKSNRDEAKGSIIECINSGRIKTLITNALMDEDKLVIIPDAVTIDAMDEYELLAEAPYKLCYINDNCEVEETDVASVEGWRAKCLSCLPEWMALFVTAA